MIVVRYLDVCLVLATAPFVLIGGLPTTGYMLGGGAWLLTRLGTEAIYTRAQRVRDPKGRAGLQVGAMMARIWIVALAVLAARYAGGKSDGIMAAALLLAAFTVYLALSFVYQSALTGKPSPSGKPSVS